MKKPYMAGSILFVVVIISTLFASVEIFSRADGVVVAENSAIKISSPQAGIVEEVFVKSGQHIKKGKVIAKLTDSEIKINLENLYKELNYARNKLLVLNNIIYNKSFQTPYRPSLFQLLQEKQEDYIKEIKRLVKLYDKEKHIIESLVKKGTLPKIREISLNQKILRDKKEISKSNKDFWEKIIYDSEQQRYQIIKIKNQIKLEELKLKNTEIIAKKDSIINKVDVNEGEYVSPGQTIVEKVPNHESIKVRLLISPDDIGGISVGQKVRLQIITFNYNIFGTSNAQISYISPDAVEDTISGKYFTANCTLEQNFVIKNNKKFYLKPGMKVHASIIRGNVSAFSYFVSPVIQSFHLIGII